MAASSCLPLLVHLPQPSSPAALACAARRRQRRRDRPEQARRHRGDLGLGPKAAASDRAPDGHARGVEGRGRGRPRGDAPGVRARAAGPAGRDRRKRPSPGAGRSGPRDSNPGAPATSRTYVFALVWALGGVIAGQRTRSPSAALCAAVSAAAALWGISRPAPQSRPHSAGMQPHAPVDDGAHVLVHDRRPVLQLLPLFLLAGTNSERAPACGVSPDAAGGTGLGGHGATCPPGVLRVHPDRVPEECSCPCPATPTRPVRLR